MALVPYKGRLRPLAQDLRKNMTRQERKLWYDFLRNLRPRFVRQKPLGNYIADFYCPTCRLAIELDGGQHYEEFVQEYDQWRTQELENLGVRVLRFCNLDVDRDFEGVCRAIVLEIENSHREESL